MAWQLTQRAEIFVSAQFHIRPPLSKHGIKLRNEHA
jgi:hypothetical protein